MQKAKHLNINMPSSSVNSHWIVLIFEIKFLQGALIIIIHAVNFSGHSQLFLEGESRTCQHLGSSPSISN